MKGVCVYVRISAFQFGCDGPQLYCNIMNKLCTMGLSTNKGASDKYNDF